MDRTARKIGWMLFACSWLAAVAIESGEFSSWDTANRLQVTRWLWTDEPQVRNADESWYGVRGRHGEKYAWTGLGQSIWMLPAHIIALPSAPAISSNPKFAEKFEEISVTYLTFPLTTALAVVAIYALLLSLGFSVRAAGLAALAAFWCTSLLPYTKVNQENALMLLTTVTALWAASRGLQSARYGWWILAGGAVGFAMLTRLTMGLDALAVALFTLLLLAADRRATLAEHLRRLWPRLALAVAVSLVFVFLERFYNFYRFESWTNTYYDLQKLAVPDYLYEGDMRIGFPGLVWSIKSNVWQFDPLALLGLGAVVFLWSQLTGRVRALAGTVLFLFCSYLLFFATRPFFDGDHAWGARYTTTPMILLSALAVGLILQFARGAVRWPRGLLAVFVVAAFAVQVSASFFWYNLEEQQQKEGLGASESMLVLRGQNIAAYATGHWESWGLMPDFPSERLRTPNYFPFLAAKYFSASAGRLLFAVWGVAVLAAVVANGVLLWTLLRQREERLPSVSV
jgi:uncharacterized membrane protein YdcZ (DUF606 family)